MKLHCSPVFLKVGLWVTSSGAGIPSPARCSPNTHLAAGEETQTIGCPPRSRCLLRARVAPDLCFLPFKGASEGAERGLRVL